MIEKVEAEIGLVERHLEVLRAVLAAEPIGIVNLSDETGYPKHKVRYSLRVLEEAGLIEPTERGAVSTEDAEDFLASHPARIDDLIEQLRSSLAELEPLPP